jgi:hypothetical protein
MEPLAVRAGPPALPVRSPDLLDQSPYLHGALVRHVDQQLRLIDLHPVEVVRHRSGHGRVLVGTPGRTPGVDCAEGRSAMDGAPNAERRKVPVVFRRLEYEACPDPAGRDELTSPPACRPIGGAAERP